MKRLCTLLLWTVIVRSTIVIPAAMQGGDPGGHTFAQLWFPDKKSCESFRQPYTPNGWANYGWPSLMTELPGDYPPFETYGK